MDSGVVKLTKRELEVLRVSAKLETAEEVGKALYISTRTVGFHRSRAYGKLGVKNIVGAIRVATALGYAIF